MREIVVSPEGRDAIEIGGFTDDAGDRFVAMMFQRNNDERVIITLRTPLFKELAGHMRHVAQSLADEEWWASQSG